MTAHLTPEELALRFRMINARTGAPQTGTLSNWRRHGRGPRYIKAGGKILYPLEEVVRWEASRTIGHTAEATAAILD